MGIDYGLSMMFKDCPLHQKEHKEAIEKYRLCMKAMAELRKIAEEEELIRQQEEEDRLAARRIKEATFNRRRQAKEERQERWDFS